MDEYKTYENEDVQEMFLCLPCAKRYENGEFNSVKSIKIGAHLKSKHECEHCGGRRFGYQCKVEFDYGSNRTTTNRRW